MPRRIGRAGIPIAEADDQLADDVLDEVIVGRRDPFALQLFLREGERRDEEIDEHLLHGVALGVPIGDGDRSGSVAE